MFAAGSPVLVDINPDTLSFDVADLKRKLTKKTRGVLWPHLLGVISRDYRDIVAFCRKNRLFILEDCAQAHGAQIDGKKAGSLGDAACFSFYATKIIAAGSGGLIASNNGGLIDYANKMRLFGKDPRSGRLVDFGNDWILDEFRSAVIFRHFQDIRGILAERRTIAGLYLNYLKTVDGISFLDYGRNANPAFYQFAVLLDRGLDRDKVIKALKERYKIDARPLYVPIHKEGIFARLDTHDLKKAEVKMRRLLCLPLHHFMTEADVKYVASALKKLIA
jgi:perosamine synthetase